MPATVVRSLQTAANNIPAQFKPPLAVALNLSLTSLFAYLLTPYIEDASSITPSYPTLAAYRSLEVLTYWYYGWDATEAAAIHTLALAPALHFTNLYTPSVSLRTLSLITTISLVSTYAPLAFLRPTRSFKTTRALSDPLRLMSSLLASTVYQISLQVLTTKFLTVFLLAAGWDLESVSSVHSITEAGFLVRAGMMLPVGLAASEVLFLKNEGRQKKRAQEEDLGFLARLWYKGLSERSRQVVQRTAVVCASQAAGAGVQVAGVVSGGNLKGAAGLGGVWVAATAVVGLVLGWAGNV